MDTTLACQSASFKQLSSSYASVASIPRLASKHYMQGACVCVCVAWLASRAADVYILGLMAYDVSGDVIYFSRSIISAFSHCPDPVSAYHLQLPIRAAPAPLLPILCLWLWSVCQSG